MSLFAITSTIYDNVISGLSGINVNNRFTMDQIEDDVIRERLGIIKEYSLKDLIPKKDLLMSINCIDVDCRSIERCCLSPEEATMVRHAEVPQILNDFGAEAVEFLGSIDRVYNFTLYTDLGWRNHKYRRRGADKPYVWIDTTPNENNMNDVFIFNAPLINTLSISAIFKDPRQVQDFSCCGPEDNWNYSFLDKDIISRVTEKYIRYYRQGATAHTPNDQAVK